VWGVADRLGERYGAGERDRVVLVYASFLGGMRSEVRSEVLLPVTPEEMAATDTIFEPAPGELLSGLMRRYLRTEMLGMVWEAAASEHAARVAAMTAATDNTEDMIRSLTLAYNKARQASITSELTEIVSAAEATA
ncbi:MAG: F0F1 ATP synthase subunit gamma, partial [Proteobacteria bacterium]|nr:F0F1 ATP synthase subunit gamma [Pseudomonadota bacterium]